jgi:hypothetical protein
LLTYTTDGQLLNKDVNRPVDLSSEFAAETETTGGYALRGCLVPQVIDTRRGRTVIANSWPQQLIAGPDIPMAYMVIGTGLAALSAWRRWRLRRAAARAAS